MKHSKIILILSLAVISISIVVLSFILITKTDFPSNFNTKIKTLAQKITATKNEPSVAKLESEVAEEKDAAKDELAKDAGANEIDENISADKIASENTKSNIETAALNMEVLLGDADNKDSKNELSPTDTDTDAIAIIPETKSKSKTTTVKTIKAQRKVSLANHDIVYDDENNRIAKVSEMSTAPAKTATNDLPPAKTATYFPTSKKIADGFVPADGIDRNYVYDPNKDSQQIERNKQREAYARAVQANNQYIVQNATQTSNRYFEITTSPDTVSQVTLKPRIKNNRPADRIDGAGVFYDIDTTLEN